jgi:hypothetical protein
LSNRKEKKSSKFKNIIDVNCAEDPVHIYEISEFADYVSGSSHWKVKYPV